MPEILWPLSAVIVGGIVHFIWILAFHKTKRKRNRPLESPRLDFQGGRVPEEGEGNPYEAES